MSLTNSGMTYYGRQGGAASSGQAAFILDADGEQLAWIFYPPKTGDIDEITFCTATVTTGDTMKVGLQGVDLANGEPDGVYLGGGSPASATQVIGDGDDNTFFTVTLDNAHTVVAVGTPIALVVEFNSYVAGNLALIGLIREQSAGYRSFPYPASKVGGTWTFSDDDCAFGISYAPSTPVYVAGAVAVRSVPISFNSTDNPDEIGTTFNLPVPAQFRGIKGMLAIQGDWQYVLYSNAGTPFAEYTSPIFDKDVQAQGSSFGAFEHIVNVGDEVTLTKDTDYFLLFKPGAADIQIAIFTFPGSDHLVTWNDNANCHYASRVDGGAISVDNTKIVVVQLVLDQFDDGTGGVGGGPVRRVGGLLAR